MFSVLIRELCQNVFFRIMIMIEFIIVFLLVSFCDSAVVGRFHDYSEFSYELENKKGILIQQSMAMIDLQTGFFVNDAEKYLKKNMPEIEHVYAEYQTPVYDGKYNSVENIPDTEVADNIIVYDDDFFYKPELSEGRFASNETGDKVEVVVPYNNGRIKIGDKISLLPFFQPDGNGAFDAVVVGILKENAKLYDYNNFQKPTDDINCLYSVSDQANMIYLTNKNQLAGKSVDYYAMGNMMITFRDQITRKQIKKIQEKITNENAIERCLSYQQIVTTTKNEIFEDLLQTLPLLIAGFLLTLISIIGIIVYTTKTKQKQIAIYFMCGLSRRKYIIGNNLKFFIFAIICFLLSQLFMATIMRLSGIYQYISIFRLFVAILMVVVELFIVTLVLKKSISDISIITIIRGE